MNILGTTVTLFVTNNYGENSEDFILNILKIFDLDIVKGTLILKDRTPQYIEKYNQGQNLFEVTFFVVVKNNVNK